MTMTRSTITGLVLTLGMALFLLLPAGTATATASTLAPAHAALASLPVATARPDQPTPTAVCDTDTDCAAWSLAHGRDGDPLLDDTGDVYCLPGATLADTEDVTRGDQGVVCRVGSPAVGDRVLDDDDPAFDCRIDGNRQCGVAADIGGPYPLVMPSGFPWWVCPTTDGVLSTNDVGMLVCTYGGAA